LLRTLQFLPVSRVPRSHRLATRVSDSSIPIRSVCDCLHWLPWIYLLLRSSPSSLQQPILSSCVMRSGPLSMRPRSVQCARSFAQVMRGASSCVPQLAAAAEPAARCPHIKDVCRNRALHPRLDVVFLKNAEGTNKLCASGEMLADPETQCHRSMAVVIARCVESYRFDASHLKLTHAVGSHGSARKAVWVSEPWMARLLSSSDLE
jgi:hypothetical protein